MGHLDRNFGRYSTFWKCTLMSCGSDCQQLRMKERIGNVISRKRKTVETKWRKEMESLNAVSSKWRVRTESHSVFQLLERMVVVAANLVWGNERM
jgi:hypothetical protein